MDTKQEGTNMCKGEGDRLPNVSLRGCSHRLPLCLIMCNYVHEQMGRMWPESVLNGVGCGP